MSKSSSQSPVWFVTGSSSGFGLEFVRMALAHGFRVAATARDPKKLKELVPGHEDNMLALELDVTKPGHIKRAVRDAERAFGKIDVLVNNAGYGYLAAVEEGEDKEIRAMFDTNFFGLAGADACRSPWNAREAARNDCQYRIGRGNRRLSRVGILRGNEVRRRRIVGVSLKGGRTAWHPRDASRAWSVPYRLGRPITEAIFRFH